MLMTTTRIAPAFWGSALINGHASGLDEKEAKLAFAWAREQGLGMPVSADNLDAHGFFNGVKTETYTYEFLVSVPLDEAVVPAYLEAARFTDGGSDHPAIEEAEFSDAAKAAARRDCEDFIRLHLDSVIMAVTRTGYSWERLAHDLWLTRNRHGAGFWDRMELRGEGLGDQLTILAQKLSCVHAYMDDDGFISFE